ncbi:PH domain-containing protein [Shewanella sp. OMA3-2]|uniref:PH domain-containing protein n=1 Tax=Shewanella sp. OMA3-2 TaxID=2908650 RepID=UPI001F282B1F|nr:PH domain-containing protein [Shewanella sp. OMA3-2]UJF21504.1 PH domain-containing protein [Shewanella sp. OMA3-2]
MVNISDTEVEARTGVLTHRLDKLNLKTVENIEVISTLGGRIFGYSSIYLYAYGSWVHLPFITNCDQVKASLEGKIDLLRGGNA